MAVPTSIDARLYYRCAYRRFEEAQVLLKAAYTTGAVYLAGYGVECMFKALLLENATRGKSRHIMESFRGAKAHDFEWLLTQYIQNGGSRLPLGVKQDFTLVSEWSTNMRYLPTTIDRGDADAFLKACYQIILWADARL